MQHALRLAVRSGALAGDAEAQQAAREALAVSNPWRVQETAWHNDNGSTYITGKAEPDKFKRGGRQVLVARVFVKTENGDRAAAGQRLAMLAAQVAATPVLIAALRLAVDAGTLPADVERDALALAIG